MPSQVSCSFYMLFQSCSVVVFTYYSRVALVGGICFTLVFFVKSFCWALFMFLHLLVLSYSRMTNLSVVCITHANKAGHKCCNQWGHGTLEVPGSFLVQAQWLFCELPIVRNVCQMQILARAHTLHPGFMQQMQPALQHLYPLSWSVHTCMFRWLWSAAWFACSNHAAINPCMVAWGKRMRIMQQRLATMDTQSMITSCFTSLLNVSNWALDKMLKSLVCPYQHWGSPANSLVWHPLPLQIYALLSHAWFSYTFEGIF